MTTAFPGAIDAFTNPTATDALDSATVPHAAQHANVNDAVEAIETAIGTTGAPVLAKLASPTFTGTPAAPTAAVGTNTTQIATTAFVQTSKALFGFTSGLYYRGLGQGTNNNTPVLSETLYVPFNISETKTFDRIAIQTGSSYVGTGAVRLGIYNNDSTTGKPSTVVLDAGTVATTAASTIYEITISQSLSAGAYWIAFNMQTAPATPRFQGASYVAGSAIGFQISTTGVLVSNAGVWLQSGVTGAFATAGTLTSASSGSTCTLRAT